VFCIENIVYHFVRDPSASIDVILYVFVRMVANVEFHPFGYFVAHYHSGSGVFIFQE
jgi:hypothetical protein